MLPQLGMFGGVPAPMNDPVYVEQKVRRLSLPNVRPGTLVDYSYTVEELKPFRAGDFFAPWRVNPGTLVRRSRLLLDTPVGLVPRVVEQRAAEVSLGRQDHRLRLPALEHAAAIVIIHALDRPPGALACCQHFGAEQIVGYVTAKGSGVTINGPAHCPRDCRGPFETGKAQSRGASRQVGFHEKQHQQS